MRVSTIRPGLLVSLKTSVRGGVTYTRRDLATETAADPAPVAPADGLAHAEAAHLAAASGPAATVKAAADALAALSKDWPRDGMRAAAIRAGQLGHPFALPDILAQLQRAADDTGAGGRRELQRIRARQALAAAGGPAPAAAPRGAGPLPPPSAPIEGPPDSTSLEAAAAPDLATMRAAGEMAERLATMARAAAGPDLKRQARMLRSEAARIRAPRAGIAPAIRRRWAIAASMLEYGAQVLADQAAAPGAVRAAAPATGPGFKPAAWRSCTAPARRGGLVRARRAWHAARHPVATGPPCTAAPRVAPV